MVEDGLEREIGRAKGLSPEARARIAETLRGTIEAEVSAGGPGGLGPAAAGFSRGILFSKSTDLARVREVVLPQLLEMDDARFERFAKRLASLRAFSTKGPEAGS